jgi:tRNA(Arg) A34 adenosine deaminase TadA
MHPPKLKSVSKAPQSPPLIYVQASHAEIIVLQAALQHYRDYIRCDKELAQAIPLIQSFIQRLHEQLPARGDMQSPQLPSLTYLQASHTEIIVLQAALRHYRDYVSYEQELTQTIPLIQAFMQRLHDQTPSREGPYREDL